MVRRASVVLGVAAMGLVGVAPASAAPVDVVNLSGTWTSASAVATPGAPYYTLKLTKACRPATCYDGVFRFHFQDGTVSKKIKVGVAQDSDPLTFSIVFPGGSLVNDKKVLRGYVANDGSLEIHRCWKYLPEASKKTAADFCSFPTIR